MKKSVKIGLIAAGITVGVGAIGYLAYRGWKSVSKSLEDCVIDNDDLCDGLCACAGECDNVCACECHDESEESC